MSVWLTQELRIINQKTEIRYKETIGEPFSGISCGNNIHNVGNFSNKIR